MSSNVFTAETDHELNNLSSSQELLLSQLINELKKTKRLKMLTARENNFDCFQEPDSCVSM